MPHDAVGDSGTNLLQPDGRRGVAVQQQRQLAQHVVDERAPLRVRVAAVRQLARVHELVYQRAQLRLAGHLVHLLEPQVTVCGGGGGTASVSLPSVPLHATVPLSTGGERSVELARVAAQPGTSQSVEAVSSWAQGPRCTWALPLCVCVWPTDFDWCSLWAVCVWTGSMVRWWEVSPLRWPLGGGCTTRQPGRSSAPERGGVRTARRCAPGPRTPPSSRRSASALHPPRRGSIMLRPGLNGFCGTAAADVVGSGDGW